MKNLVLALLTIFASAAFAAPAPEGELTLSGADTVDNSTTGSKVTEVGLTYSSINDGSAFATAGVLKEFKNGFAIGARGYVPLQYSKQASAYMASAVARFMLLNDANKMFIEGTLTQAFFNDQSGTTAFLMAGANYGFMRMITPQISVGGVLGVEFSPDRVTRDSITASSATFYNRIGMIGSYYF